MRLKLCSELVIYVEEELSVCFLVFNFPWHVFSDPGVHDRPSPLICFVDDKESLVNKGLYVRNVYSFEIEPFCFLQEIVVLDDHFDDVFSDIV